MVLASAPSTTDFKHEIAVKQFEISNHLGNVLAVITDRKIPTDDGDHDGDNNGYNENHASGGAADNIIDFYKAQVISATDYSPFGVQLDGRNFSSTAYRYGFQGQEKDDEVKGAGNSYDFGARLYDNRLGRWLTIDAMAAKYPNISSYCFVANNPIIYRDYDGNDFEMVIDHENKTITIKATYYTKVDDAASKKQAEIAVAVWNAQSKKFQYVVGKGKNKVRYDIIFELDVQTDADPKAKVDEHKAVIIEEGIDAESGKRYTVTDDVKTEMKANSFMTMTRDDFEKTKKELKATEKADGLTVNAHYIYMPDNPKGDEVIETAHEVGHTLGLDHFLGSLMGKNETEWSNKIDYRLISVILGVAGVTTNYLKDGANSAKSKVEHIKNEKAPENFKKGEVQKNKSNNTAQSKTEQNEKEEKK